MKVTAPAVLVSASLVLLAPLALDVALYVHHVSSYAGVCGPHAPDIPAHPCTEADYRAEFGAGFGGAALLMIDLVLAFFVAVTLTAFWLAVWWWSRRRVASTP